MPDRDYPRIVAQDETLVLVDTGVVIEGREEEPPLAAHLGRVYDLDAAALLPAAPGEAGRRTAYGSFLNHSEWYEVSLAADEVSEIEQRVGRLLADE